MSGRGVPVSRAALYKLERTLRRREGEQKRDADAFLTWEPEVGAWAYAECQDEVAGESAIAAAEAFAEAGLLVRALREGARK